MLTDAKNEEPIPDPQWNGLEPNVLLVTVQLAEVSCHAEFRSHESKALIFR